MDVWKIWVMLAVVTGIVEVFAPSFLAASLGAGCLLAALASFLGGGVEVQLLAFSLGTLIAFFAARPLMMRYGYRRTRNHATNAAALAGKRGYVATAFDPVMKRGRVVVEGDDWMAETDSRQVLEAGVEVEVVRVDSTLLVVKPI
jgi:membrane protein implicated in regulation of membrane protease activity